MSYQQLIRFAEDKKAWIRKYYWAGLISLLLLPVSFFFMPFGPLIGVGTASFVLIAPVWFLPIYLIWNDQNLFLKERLIWIFFVLFASWFVWILYMLVAPVIPNDRDVSA